MNAQAFIVLSILLQSAIFFEDIRSKGQLMEIAADRFSICQYLGYDPHEPLPDHSSLTRIRERYGLQIFRGFLLPFDGFFGTIQQQVDSLDFLDHQNCGRTARAVLYTRRARRSR